MSQQEAFEKVLASLHEAMLDDARWPETSARIDEVCGTKGNHLLFSAEAPQGVEIFFTRFCYRGVHRKDREQEYFREYYPVDAHLPKLRQLPDSKIVHVTETFSEQDLKKSLTYNEAMPRFEFQNGLNVRLDGPRGSRIIWGMADPVDANGWSSDQTHMVARLLPHIRQFVRVRHALVETGALKTTLTELLENTGVGIVHLDRHGRIVVMNDRAQELIREGDVLSDPEGELLLSSSEENTALQRLLARALPPPGGQGESGSMVVRPRGGAPPSVVLHVLPVAHPPLDFRTWRTAALVLAVEPKRPGRLDRHVLRATLGLSAAESEVAALVGEGYSVPEIKVAIGRGVHTVRWHIKQSLAKVGVSRQADLTRIVQAVGGYLPPRDEK